MGQPRSSGHHFSLSSTGSQSSPTTTSESISPHSKPKVCLDISYDFECARSGLLVCDYDYGCASGEVSMCEYDY